MKKLKRILKIVVVNVIVFALLLELVSVGIYFSRHKTFFYTHKRSSEAAEIIESNVDRQLTDKRFHPFFGYTYKAGLNTTNNYGFICPYDFPLKRENKNQYFIGIFGGSVADDFYKLGTLRLTEKFKRHSFFVDKEIIYLNFAMGGYKQPQQLQVLSYFLSIGQELDMVIDIDGFNEIIFCFNNNRLNVDIGMPSAQHFLPMRDLMDSNAVTGDKLESLWNIQRLKLTYDRIKETMRTTPLASIYLILSAYNKTIYKNYREELLKFDRSISSQNVGESIVNVKYTQGSADETRLISGIASFWSRCSILMNRAVTSGTGQRMYFHFLQPNQYHSQKVFSPEEKTSALNYDTAYFILTQKGYPALVREVENLKKNNVNAFDAAGIFDKVKETVYIDNCCHFNRLGNEIFADFIADSVLACF